MSTVDRELEQRLKAVGVSTDIDGLLALGCDLADQNRDTDAETCFRRAADLGSSVGAYNLGNSLAVQERWLEAVRAFEPAAAAGVTDAWFNLGQVLHELGDLAGEIRAYEQAEAAGDTKGTVGLAFCLREQGDRDGAMQTAQRAAAAGNAMAAGVVACWEWDQTQDHSLEDALRAGAEHYQSARAALAHLLVDADRIDEARRVLERGAKLGEVDSWLPLGNLYTNYLDDDEAAEAAYRAGIDADDLHSHHNLGVLLEARGDLENAAEQYRLGAAGGDGLAARALTNLLEP